MLPAAPADLDSDVMYRLLVQEVTDYAIYLLSPEGIVSNWNAGAQRAKGYTAEEIVGQHFSRFYTEADRAIDLPRTALRMARETGKFEGEGWRLRKDGTPFWAHVIIDPVRDGAGRLLAYAKITRDLTEKKRQSDRLQEVSRNLDLALSHMSQGLCLFDREERLVLLNARFRQMFALPEGACQAGMSMAAVLGEVFGQAPASHAGLAAELARIRGQFASPEARPSAIALELPRDGRTIAVSHRGLPGGGWVFTMDDITELRQIEGRILHMAHHDALTDLPNRVTFRQRVESLAQQAAPSGLWSVLYLDLDRFKPVNDTLGHAAGDELLKAVAGRIQRLLRKTDIVARIGGDEFVVLQAECRGLADISALAERMIREISRPFKVKGIQVVIGVSIGIAVAPQNGSDAEVLLRNADLALYRAKEEGRSCYRYYEPAMDLIAQQRHELEQNLRRALREDQFELYFQPLVNLDQGSISGFEALIRWNSPARGKVSPGDFIPFAEEVGLMPDIGAWVLRTACREAAGWGAPLKVSVNVSPTQFRRADLIETIRRALKESSLPASRLELELTETAMIGDIDATAAILRSIRELGVEVAMDDFGTGYSSLSFLQSLPFTRIKIDRSFVQNLGSRPEATAIIRAVTGLCSSLNVAATAEGVETEEQVALLRAEKCTDIQGYFVSRPCPAHEVRDWITTFNKGRKGVLASGGAGGRAIVTTP